MKKKNPKYILRFLGVTILGFPAIFVEATYSGLRATHKILFTLVCIGICCGIAAYFKKVNPLDRAYYDPRARQIREESYVQIKQVYEKKYKVTLVIFLLLLSFFNELLEALAELAAPIIGVSGIPFMVFVTIVGSIPIHVLLAMHSSFCNNYKAAQVEETQRTDKQRKEEMAKAKEEYAKQQAITAENARRACEERRETERLLLERRKQLWDILLSEYSADPWVRSMIFGASSEAEITNAAIHNDFTYRLDLNKFVLYEEALPEEWLQNSDRVKWIENVFAQIPELFPGVKTNEISGMISRGFRIEGYGSLFGGEWNKRVGIIGSKVEDIITARLSYYTSQYKIAKTGDDGEIAVQQVLNMHPGAFFAIHNLRLEYVNQEGRTVSIETDTLILAPNGIFAVEVKNYGSSGKYKIVVMPDGNWYKEFFKEKEYFVGKIPKKKREVVREPLPSAFAQNSLHIGGLELIINEILGRDMANRVYVENVVVIANNEVEIESSLQGRQILTRVGTLYDCLTQSRERLFSVDELNQIKAGLEARGLPAKKYPINDYRHELQDLSKVCAWIREVRDGAESAVDQCKADHPEIFEGILG